MQLTSVLPNNRASFHIFFHKTNAKHSDHWKIALQLRGIYHISRGGVLGICNQHAEPYRRLAGKNYDPRRNDGADNYGCPELTTPQRRPNCIGWRIGVDNRVTQTDVVPLFPFLLSMSSTKMGPFSFHKWKQSWLCINARIHLLNGRLKLQLT